MCSDFQHSLISAALGSYAPYVCRLFLAQGDVLEGSEQQNRGASPFQTT